MKDNLQPTNKEAKLPNLGPHIIEEAEEYYLEGQPDKVLTALEPIWGIVKSAHKERNAPLLLSQIRELTKTWQSDDPNLEKESYARVTIVSDSSMPKPYQFHIGIVWRKCGNSSIYENYIFKIYSATQ